MVNNLEMVFRNMGRDKTIIHQILDQAISGEEALDMIKNISDTEQRYSLIFMDITMPGKDGFTTTEEIRYFCEYKNI